MGDDMERRHHRTAAGAAVSARLGGFGRSGFVLAGGLLVVAPQAVAGADGVTEIGRFHAAEARQGVAVDAGHFYAIDDRAIGKYEKASGRRVARFEGPASGAISHLNGGVVTGDRLYCAHSNYPGIPPTSSVEIWNTVALAHVGSYSFGISEGWLTWIDFYRDAWWAVFAHYGKTRRETGKDAAWTRLVRLGPRWQPEAAWVLPADLLRRFGDYSSSGGSWSTDGELYVTGHDRQELYALRLPASGSTVELAEVVSVPTPGQGIAWDRGQRGILYALDRPRQDVVILRVEGAADARGEARVVPAPGGGGAGD